MSSAAAARRGDTARGLTSRLRSGVASRVASRVAAVLAALLLAVLVVAPPATAAPWDCTDAPTPELPLRGVVSYFETPPEDTPPPGDPFAEDSTTTIYEQYGYAGLRFTTYDLGCGPDAVRSPDAVVGTAVANWVFNVAKLFVSATEAVLSAAFDPGVLATFDPLVVRAVDALRTGVFEQWVFVVLAATGALLVLRARKASLASSAAAIGWALLVLVLVTAVFSWPLAAGQAADRTVTSTLGAVYTGFSGTDPDPETATDGALAPAGRSASNLHEAVLYQAWLTGTFGNANSAVAREHGPAIFDSQALTWAQAQALREDPSAGPELFEAKAERFKATAAVIKETDPDAYAYLTGQRSEARVGAALIANLAALCALPFLLLSALLVLGALIIVRLGVMLFPAFATLGLFPVMRGLVTGIGNTLAAAVINAIVFGIGAAVMVAGIGVLLDPGSALAPWLSLVLVGLLSVVMWVVLRPFRRLTAMASPGRSFFADGAGALSAGGRRATAGAAHVVRDSISHTLGRLFADAVRKDRHDDDTDPTTDSTEPEAREPRAEATSLPPQRGPVDSSEVPAGRRHQPGDAPSRASGSPWRPEPAAPSSTGAPPPVGDAARVDGDNHEGRQAGAAPASAGTASPVRGLRAQHHGDADAGGQDDIWRPSTADAELMPDAIEPQEADDEEVYALYRPSRAAGSEDDGRV